MSNRAIRFMSGLIGVLIIGILLFPQDSLALSCAEMPQTEEAYQKAYEKADVVFKGTVRKEKENSLIFQVHAVMKGDADARVVAKDETRGGWLTQNLEKGETYLVFGTKKWLHLEVSPCGPTGEWDELKGYAETFPNAETILYQDSNFESETRMHRIQLIGSGFGAVLFLAVFYWWKRTR